MASYGTAGDDLSVRAVISGGSGVGLVKAGPGTMWLAEGDTFFGPTLVSAGTLVAANANALGTSSAHGTTVDAGATLQLRGGVTFARTDVVTLNGPGFNGAGALENAGGNSRCPAPRRSRVTPARR